MTLFRACQNPPYARPDRHFVFSWIFVVSSFLMKKEDLAVITPRPARLLVVRGVHYAHITARLESHHRSKLTMQPFPQLTSAGQHSVS